MKQLNVKKLVLLNLPYFLLGLFATNLGEAWRLATGADASAKMLSFFSTLPVALGSWWPSLHPLDFLVGICCGAGLRLAVYLKGKNAKKYRHNVEYGSARWGTHEDIAPYIDPVFQNNVILTQTERLTMSSRPKNPKYARNKNVLVIGGSGSGKTRFWLKPNLMQMHSSYVVTDPKGTILVECGKMLQRGAPKLGKDGKPFIMYKFRSMTDARGADGELLPDAQRLTPFGRRLRSTSLDELPELWNILRGDMSIVGPRPLLVKYLPYYTQTERRRHAVRPGLTGLAQVNGRNALRWEDRFAYDVDYVDHISFALDAKIVLMTVGKVLSRSDVAEDTAASEGNLEEIRRKEMTVEG